LELNIPIFKVVINKYFINPKKKLDKFRYILLMVIKRIDILSEVLL